MPLTHENVLDLANATLREQGKFRMGQLAADLRNFPVMNDMLKKDKVKFDGGDGISRNVMTDMGGSSRQAGLHARDIVNIADHTNKVQVNWKHTYENYAWERREFLMNKGASKILDLVKTRRAAAFLRLAHHWENQFWVLPTADDGTNINGAPYWIVRSASAAGFNGGTPSGYSTAPGGLTHAKFKNYTFTYSNITKTDALAAMRTAMRQTSFKCPIDVNDYRQGNGVRYRIHTNFTVQDQMEVLLEEQNDNLGTDLWKFDGAPTFRRAPIVAVDKLNDDTTDPIYIMDMAQFYPVFLEGDYMTESAAQYMDGQHNTLAVYIDCTVNWICNDRRAQTIGYRV